MEITSNISNEQVMKSLFIFFAIGIATMAKAQNNDDVYYSPSQKPAVVESENAVEETPAPVIYEEPPYSTPDGQQFDGTGNVDAGSNEIEVPYKKGISTETYDDGNGDTYITNNYYGDVYNNDDYSYSTNLRRFYSPAPGFGYYSPCYDPFWGYNNWYYQPGFTISIGIGYGYPWYGGGYGWGYPAYGWGYPYYGWGNPYYGWGYPYYGYGYGYPYYPYYGHGGYHHGYNEGYNGYSTYYGPRRSAAGSGGTDVHSGSVTGPRVIKSEAPSGNTNKTSGINQYNRNVSTAPSNSLGQPSGTNSINKNTPSTGPSRNISGYKYNMKSNPGIKNPSVQPSGVKPNSGNKGNIRMEQQKNIKNNNAAPATPKRSTPGGSQNYSPPKSNMPSMQQAPSAPKGGGGYSQPRKVR